MKSDTDPQKRKSEFVVVCGELRAFFDAGLDKPAKEVYNIRYVGVAQLVRAFGSHPRGHGFEPPRLHQKNDRIARCGFSLSKNARQAKVKMGVFAFNPERNVKKPRKSEG